MRWLPFLSSFLLFLQFSFGSKCPPLPFSEVKHGSLVRKNHKQVVVKCDKGYFLGGGQRNLICRNGKWNERIPYCIFADMQCHPPPHVPHANVIGDNFEVGQSVLYVCHEGYSLVKGDGKMTCLAGGKWGVHKPICEADVQDVRDVANRLGNSFINKLGSISSTSKYYTKPINSCINKLGSISSTSKYYTKPINSFINKLGSISSTSKYYTKPINSFINKLGSFSSTSKYYTKPINSFINKLGSISSTSAARALGPDIEFLGLEMVFVIDRSSSISSKDLNRAKMFLNYLVDQFGVNNTVNKGGTRLAVVTFGTKAQLLLNLNNKTVDTPDKAKIIINMIPPQGGGSDMGDAFSKVFVDVTPVLRKGAKRALFLVTDGEPTDQEISPEEYISNLKEGNDFEVFIIGIGTTINPQRLRSMVTEPSKHHYFQLQKFEDFSDIIWFIKNKPTEAPPPGPEKCGYLPEKDEEVKEENPNILDDWPWIATIYTNIGMAKNNMSGEIGLCGGVLLCDQWVLTAASCLHTFDRRAMVAVDMKQVFVVLGENVLTEEDQTQRNFYAKQIKLHPNYTMSHEHDLALIKLNEPVPLNVIYRPACLPDQKRLLPLSEDMRISVELAGWGAPVFDENEDIYGITAATANNKLSTVNLRLADHLICKDKIRDIPVSSHMFCAGFE
ncbi:complement factor B-like isoform X1 [Limulus polyphemus]|uniref:C3/C5 convertase n=1 Tax=Limulus polyphemus TaxID=6850 RepID=A0ABM1T7E9_LIMPO|nr:complement factor B-like isoform X1 [Limulus polyphemus]